MAGCAIVNDTVTCPVAYPFPMGSSKPVPLLPKMALPTELITVIKIDFSTFFVFQKVPVLRMMAIDTAEIIAFLAMVDNNIAMGEFLRIPG